jgi:hypothetical protein
MSEAETSSRGTPATEATLTELAQKLSELRAHLERVAATLDARPEDSRVSRQQPGATTVGHRLGDGLSADGRLLCHECGRVGSKEDARWTLRLCADDELHAFCPGCDSRYFNGEGKPDPETPLRS